MVLQSDFLCGCSSPCKVLVTFWFCYICYVGRRRSRARSQAAPATAMEYLAYLPEFINELARVCLDHTVGLAFLGLGLVGFVIAVVRRLMS